MNAPEARRAFGRGSGREKTPVRLVRAGAAPRRAGDDETAPGALGGAPPRIETGAAGELERVVRTGVDDGCETLVVVPGEVLPAGRFGALRGVTPDTTVETAPLGTVGTTAVVIFGGTTATVAVTAGNEGAGIGTVTVGGGGKLTVVTGGKLTVVTGGRLTVVTGGTLTAVVTLGTLVTTGIPVEIVGRNPAAPAVMPKAHAIPAHANAVPVISRMITVLSEYRRDLSLSGDSAPRPQRDGTARANSIDGPNTST